MKITIYVQLPEFREPGYTVWDTYPKSHRLNLYTTVTWDRDGEPFAQWDHEGDKLRMEVDVLARKTFYEKLGHEVVVEEL